MVPISDFTAIRDMLPVSDYDLDALFVRNFFSFVVFPSAGRINGRRYSFIQSRIFLRIPRVLRSRRRFVDVYPFIQLPCIKDHGSFTGL